MISGRLQVLSLAAIALALGACAADNEGPGGHNGNATARLEIVGSSSRNVEQGAEALLEVRYLLDDQTVADQVVDFAISGDLVGGATLSARGVSTDENGVAGITLRAGSPAVFTVTATAEGVTDPAVINISVGAARFGTVDYTVDYAGRRDVRNAEAALFTNVTCTALRTRVPTPREQHTTRIGQMQRLDRVEIGANHAIYALGIDGRDGVAAEGCVDVRIDQLTTSVHIPLTDITAQYGGNFTAEEQFDVTSGLNPALDELFNAMRGLSTDPAAYLIDFVYRADFTPGWLRTALGSSAVRNLAANMLRDAIEDITVPGYVTDVLELGADFDRAMSGMVLVGDLTFGEPNEFNTTRGRRTVRLVRIPVDGLMVDRAVSASADVSVTVSGTSFAMAEHELAISFGQLAQLLLNEVLLPTLPGSPRSMGELIRNTFDCAAIADSISGGDPTITGIVNAGCSLGAAALGDYLESSVTNLFGYDVLHATEAPGTTFDRDQDYDIEEITATSAGRWTGTSGEMLFPGTFRARRVDDVSGRRHPVREIMRNAPSGPQ